MDSKTTYQQIVQQVAKQIDLPEEVVNETYKSFWLWIKQSIEGLPLKDRSLTPEDFEKLNTSFNIPSLGKLVYTKSKFEKLTNYFKNKYKDED